MHKLNLKETALLVATFIVGYVFTVTQKYYIIEALRPFTYLLFLTALFFLFFYLVKPAKPLSLSNTLALVLFVVVVLIILVQDVLIMHQVSYRTLIVLAGAVGLPYLIGALYKLARSVP